MASVPNADAGLLYLNARYYDPQLAMFLQPDWWEVTEPGVGTNRYAYAGGDPVTGSDPGGNESLEASSEPEQGSWFERMFLGTKSHEVWFSSVNATGNTNTLTNRRMSTASEFFSSLTGPFTFTAGAVANRDAAAQALS